MGSLLQSTVQQKRIVVVTLTVCLVVLFHISSITKDAIFAVHTSGRNKALHNFLQNATLFDQVWIQQQPLSSHATLVLELQRATEERDEDHVASTGFHTAHVFFNEKHCPDPHFGVRLTGTKAALVPIQLFQSSTELQQWTGSFHLSVDGAYRVDAKWYGCGLDDESEGATELLSIDDASKDKTIEFQVVGPTTFPPKSFVRLLEHSPPSIGEGAAFSDGVWMSTQGMSFVKPKTDANLTVDVSQYTDYLWANPNLNNVPDPRDLMILDDEEKNIHTIISRNGTLTEEHKTYIFNHVGNYELVCFFGSQSAKTLHDHFITQLKSNMVVQGVRPFKFHFYNVTNLIYPDGILITNKTCRKCKHIILSVDELDNGPMSQTDFQHQYSTFVKHLQKLMDDSTFPIWLLTNNEPVSIATNCHPPYVLPRTSDHPCNDVIRDLMRRGVFERRVNLMDNADLTMPFFDDVALKHRAQINANIALRIFVLVGKGVQDWRDRGQIGKADGLHRNGTVEPNFELVPYDWNQTV